jgi:uncharacterized protein
MPKNFRMRESFFVTPFFWKKRGQPVESRFFPYERRHAMSNPLESVVYRDTVAAQATAVERGRFIVRTYLHLFVAILAFIAVEILLVNLPMTPALVQMMVGSRFSWLIVLGAFMGISWLANSWASSDTSLGMQYLGLAFFVVAEAVIFLPLIFIAGIQSPEAIPAAALTSLGIFGVLTLAVFITRHDFSFLRTGLIVGGFAALGFIVVAIIFQFNIGIIFSYLMVVLACGYILYDTSNVLHHYRTSQHVAAALALFASVALLFWYILRIFSRD